MVEIVSVDTAIAMHYFNWHYADRFRLSICSVHVLCTSSIWCWLVVVTHCREAVLDAQCVSSIASLGKQKIQALPTGFDNFNIIEFVTKLV